MRQVLAAALLAISATVVPGTDHARAAECQLVPLLSGDPDGVVPPVSDVAVSLAGLPLTMSAGKVLLDGYNSLVPKFDSACGTHLSASILDDRVRLDVANGQDGPSFANLSMDLAPGGGPVGRPIPAQTRLSSDMSGRETGWARSTIDSRPGSTSAFP